LIKGSKDSDLSLVSNEHFSEILRPSGWDLGQVTRAKMAQKLLMTSLTKNPQPPTKYFFQVQTRLAYLFEPLNSSLAQSAEELWRW